MREKLKLLLKDYSMEELLERCDVDPIDALELLIAYGELDLVWSGVLVEGTDVEV